MNLPLLRRPTNDTTTTDPTDTGAPAGLPRLAAATDLPSGYDVPSSPFYVPDELRPFYRVDRDAETKEWNAGYADAVFRPKDVMGKHKLRTDAAYVETLRQRGIIRADTDPTRVPWERIEATVIDELTDVDREKYFHGHRLRLAREALKLQAATDDARERARTRTTDEVTGAYPAAVRREKVGESYVIATRESLDVLALRRVLRLAEKRLPDGRTLGQAADEYLDAHPDL